MRSLFLATCLSTLLLLAGCSFRAPVPLAGEVTDVAILSAGLNLPTRISAHVVFVGQIESPTLAVIQDAHADTIRVMAFATPGGPLFGLGVLPVDRQSRHAFDLETSVIVPQPGHYRIEGLSGPQQVVTASAEMQID